MGQHQYRPGAPMARRARQVGVAHVDAVRLLWLRRACARVPAARPLRLDARWSRSRIAASRGVRQSRHSMPSRRSRVATRSSFGHPPRPRTRRYRAGSSSPTIGGRIHRLVAAEPDPARGSRFGLIGAANDLSCEVLLNRPAPGGAPRRGPARRADREVRQPPTLGPDTRQPRLVASRAARRAVARGRR